MQQRRKYLQATFIEIHPTNRANISEVQYWKTVEVAGVENKNNLSVNGRRFN